MRETRHRFACGKIIQGGKLIAKQPIIFNITYTPWKLKCNATAEERKKFERERPYYEMSDGGNNIYKYMTADRKLNGENSKSQTRDMISYFQKNTGVFNGDGVISREELKAIQERAKAPKNLWHGFISLDKEMNHKIDTPEKCIHLVKRTFGEFFRDMGLDPKNIDLICSLHKDKPHHLHIHFWFAEKEPRCKYRKKQLEYRHKGKIEQSVIDRMHVRLNAFVCEHGERMYMTRDEALRELKKITFPKSIVQEDEVREALIDLAKAIPKDASFFYGKKDMEPYRKQVDEVVLKLLLHDRRARKAHLQFSKRLAKYERQIMPIVKQDVIKKKEIFKSEVIDSLNDYKAAPKTATLIDEIAADYRRRQGNIVLRAVKRIKPEIYERKRRHKVNDNNLKRRLAISHRKVSRLIGSFLSSFGQDGEYLTRDFDDRLQEIERELQAEREQQEQQHISTSRYDYGKE